jgi:hypothetical protein
MTRELSRLRVDVVLIRRIRFESDTSLTRNDYYLANGDDHSFNGTLFKMMTATAASTSSAAAP